MNPAILVACLIAQTPVPAATEAKAKSTSDLDVTFLPGARVSTMKQLEDSLTQTWSPAWKDKFTIRPADGPRKWIKVKSCADIKGIDVKEADTRPATDWDFLVGRADWCRALEAIKGAKPAKRSFLAEALAARDPAQFLPASVVDDINGEAQVAGPEKPKSNPARSAISWAQSDHGLKLAEDQTKDCIRLEGSGYLATVVYYATGDFNGDGIEDVLLQVTMRTFDASQGEGRYFVMTRTKPNGVLTVVEKLPQP